MGSRQGQQTIQGACVSETAVHDHGRRLDQREFRPMAEVPFRPVRQLSEYKGKGASASREKYTERNNHLNFLFHDRMFCHARSRENMARPVNLHGRPLDRCTIFGSVPKETHRS